MLSQILSPDLNGADILLVFGAAAAVLKYWGTSAPSNEIEDEEGQR